MALTRLKHYLVLSDDIHKTRDFYCDVLGMTEGFRPQPLPAPNGVPIEINFRT